MTGPYDDIIDLPHPISRNHPQQPMEKRAAQFSPFAALTGYDDAVEETARYTDTKQELTEESKAKINEALFALAARAGGQTQIELTYFAPDANKSGGTYRTVRAQLKKIDAFEKQLILTNGMRVPFADVAMLREADI